MKIRSKNNDFLAHLAGGVIVLIAVLFINHKNRLTTNQKAGTSPTPTESYVRVDAYFDEETRQFKSPVIEVEHGVKKRFTLRLPHGWEFEDIHPHVFVSGGYSIIIYDEYEGFRCLFDNASSNNQGLDFIELQYFSDADTPLGIFRVGKQVIDTEFQKVTKFILCRLHNNPLTGQSEWISGSEIGLITLVAPLRYDGAKVEEMFQILDSLQLFKF